ncbi:hypothetical protein [Ferribacterium limneticum]|nr:hypothetical protein [Ferribacterium limneticum]UCV26772.1 hypothetical protein KI617_10665 [Ferribacterium limneticum]UCV30689.1 hypothetical protein KI608_10665 [Ferribacterium limneticum]
MGKPLHSLDVKSFFRDTTEHVILGIFAGLILAELATLILAACGVVP